MVSFNNEDYFGNVSDESEKENFRIQTINIIKELSEEDLLFLMEILKHTMRTE
jgi:hypothetical protein